MKIKTKSFELKRLILPSGVIIVLFSIFLIVVGSLSYKPHETRNAKKVVDLVYLKRALELYAEDHNGLYPATPTTCVDVSSLETYLVPQYLQNIPTGIDSHGYYVSVSHDRSTYILKARLDRTFATLKHKDDVDGQVLGCNCDDPIFCITANKSENPQSRR